MDKKADRLLAQVERVVGELRQHLESSAEDRARAADARQPRPIWDEIDWARRQRPEWEPRGRLMNLLAEEGKTVSFDRWKELGEKCGYSNGRGMNGFFAGVPPIVIRDGDEIVLQERGYSGAAYWRGRYGGKKKGGRRA